ncbi:MAG: asparagine synthase (glutamine-hydrolyzing) [Oligoflexia bacterium]|nr:asparagine synthase (glutamine-hydrolyzing) [Oligoflexia bacterium]
MCGIVGIQSQSSVESIRSAIVPMISALKHRGPDYLGIECVSNKEFSLGFAHQRLSILDLSMDGNQPMYAKSKNWLLIFNGEIYNHQEIKKSLAHIAFQSTSDTETLVEAIDFFGFESTLKKLRGMFAIAAYDLKNNKLYLARDRMGEKPLYYGTIENDFVFASELKAFTSHEKFRKEIDEEALREFYFYGYIPAPKSIYKCIKKLLPSHYVVISSAKISSPICYWNLQQVAEQKKANLSFDEVKKNLKEKLLETVKLQSISDVPLGAFLSGGIDSSLLTALLKESIGNNTQTYSIGFGDRASDESKYAEKIAAHLQTKHTTLIASEVEALNLAEKINDIYDEPFADVSQIPTLLLAKLTKNHVTVAISGDGGDEVFSGYNRYLVIDKWNQYKTLAQYIPMHFAIPIAKKFLSFSGYPQVEEKIRKISELRNATSTQDAYSIFTRQSILLENAHAKVFDLQNTKLSAQQNIQLYDQIFYLPDDILVKVDRATMAYGLESRAPFLDHSLIEYAWTLPRNYLIHEGKGKHILRSILSDFVPKELWSRPKAGFSPPIDKWLRGPLLDWANDRLSPSSIKNNSYLSERDKATIKTVWNLHKEEKTEIGFQLWPVLIAQDWLLKNKIIS